MTLPGNLKTWHPQCWVRVYAKRTGIYLITSFVEKSLAHLRDNSNWYLRHLELFGVLVPPKKMAEFNSLWYPWLTLIYLFLTSIHNLLSPSQLWLNQYCWNYQLLLFIWKTCKGCWGERPLRQRVLRRKPARMTEGAELCRFTHPGPILCHETVANSIGCFRHSGYPWEPHPPITPFSIVGAWCPSEALQKRIKNLEKGRRWRNTVKEQSPRGWDFQSGPACIIGRIFNIILAPTKKQS